MTEPRNVGSRYWLGPLIRRGGMGEVYEGVKVADGHRVAIKVLRAEFAADRRLVARFVQERDNLCSLVHPNLVRVEDLVADGDTLAFIMELVAGGDLRKRLRVTRTLPPAVALEVTAQILDALAIVHAAGVVHRDVRPENVLIPDDQRIFVQLADFGVARVVGDDGTYATSTALVGTPSYMAPELAENEPITPAVDVYSVGCLLYEMLAGSVPFTGTPMVVLRRHTDDAPARINTSEAIWAYVSSLLAKDPAHRPTAASAALAARSLTTSLASTAPPVTLPQPDAHDTVMRAPALGDSGSGLGFSLQHATPGASVGETVLRPRVPPQSLNSSVLPCRRRRWILIAVGVVVTMFIVLAVIGSAIGKKDDASSGLPPADGGSGAASGGAAGLRRPAARWARQRSRSAVSLTALSPSAKHG